MTEIKDIESNDEQHNEPASSVAVLQRRNFRILLFCFAFVIGMVGVSYAAVPLYQIFCQVTGFGGTTNVATIEDVRSDSSIAGKPLTIRFDANVSDDLDWSFKPVKNKISLQTGAVKTVYYRVKNLSNHEITGTAAYNVSPPSAGYYFNKIDCFCFSEQKLAAGEEKDIAVQFFVDPAISDDFDAKTVNTITLSYTFFAAKK